MADYIEEHGADIPACINTEFVRVNGFSPLTDDGKGAAGRYVLLPREVYATEDPECKLQGWRALITKTRITSAVSWFFVKVPGSGGDWFRYEKIAEWNLLSH